MKGIAPIVATILMLLIVIALIAVAYTFFLGLLGTSTEQTGKASKDVISQMSKGIWIDSASGKTVIVRNLGFENINVAEITLLVGDAQLVGNWIGTTNETIEAGTAQVFNLTESCAGKLVKVVGPSNTREETCTA